VVPIGVGDDRPQAASEWHRYAAVGHEAAPVEDLKPPWNAATRFVSEPASKKDRALLRRCRTWYSTVLRSRRAPWVLAKQSSPSPSTTSAAPARAMLHDALPHARLATRAGGRTDEAQGLVDGGVVSGARACDGARGCLPALVRPSALARLSVGRRAQTGYGTSDTAACRTTFAASGATQKPLWTSSLVSRVTLAR
jgi:hypothetical protein